MGKYHHLRDHRTTVAILVEDLLGGVKSWSLRVKKVYAGHPEFNVLSLESPVYAKSVSHSYDFCAPTLEEIYDILAELKPDIVVPNYHWEVFGLCARLIREGVPLRTIGFCRTDEELFYKPLEWFEPIISQFVCVSPECAKTLGERIPHRTADIHILPSGIIVPKTLERTYQTRPIRLVYGGRMSQVQKRVWDFVPLVEALLTRSVDFQLDLVGGGSQTEELKAAMTKVPHGNRVHFHEPVTPEAMLDVWAAHDVTLLTSEYEGTSNSVLESMAFGTVPVVTNASSGIRNVVRDGENGFVVPVGDMAAMADRIAALTQSPETLERMGRAAYERSKGFSIERYEQKFSEILRRAAADEVRTWTRTETISVEVNKLIRKIPRRSKTSDPFSECPAASTPATVSVTADAIVLVAAADENFALPLAVMVCSVLANLDTRRRLHLFILDGGITESSWARLHASWNDPRLTVSRLTPDLGVLRNLKVSGHVNALAYARLLIPALLPRECGKAIYLDSDVIVLQDLARLWDTPIGEQPLLAVQDMTMPFMDSRVSVPNFDACGPYMSDAVALRHYEKYGIVPETPYLNSGVLVMNLARWRSDGTAEAVIDFITNNKESIRFWDQDGLNAVLHGTWGMLDPGWNQIPHIFRYPNAESSPFPADVHKKITGDPWIVHYATRSKPWHYDNTHPLRDRFFKYVDQTDWAGWRPDVPVNFLKGTEWIGTDASTLPDWTAPLGGRIHPAEGPAPDIHALELSLEEPGRNVQLVQRVTLDTSIAGRTIEISMQARSDEPDMLGLNVYVYTAGQRKAYSRNHPGDRVWRKIAHEIKTDREPDYIEVMIVLRGQATKPARLAAARLSFAAAPPGAGYRRPDNSLRKRVIAILPDPLRRVLRKVRASLRA